MGLFFQKEMKALLEGDANRDAIHPLIIMTIQDLEIMEGSVSSSEFSLTAFLADYIAETSNVDPLCSVHNFIVHSKKYRSRMRPSPVVFQSSLDIVDRAKTVLFPKNDATQVQ